MGAGKALAEGLIRYLVPELAPRGVRINAVAPGLVHTTSVAAMVGSEEAAAKLVERAARANPSGRAIRDSDSTSLVEYLLSPEAEFIQGQVIQASAAERPEPLDAAWKIRRSSKRGGRRSAGPCKTG